MYPGDKLPGGQLCGAGVKVFTEINSGFLLSSLDVHVLQERVRDAFQRIVWPRLHSASEATHYRSAAPVINYVIYHTHTHITSV